MALTPSIMPSLGISTEPRVTFSLDPGVSTQSKLQAGTQNQKLTWLLLQSNLTLGNFRFVTTGQAEQWTQITDMLLAQGSRREPQLQMETRARADS